MRAPVLRILQAVAMVGLVAAASPVAAQTVYDNGPPLGDVGHDLGPDWWVADDFSLESPTSFNRILFWGLMDTNVINLPSSIYWRIILDAGSAPGNNVLASGSASVMPSLVGMASGPYFSWLFAFAIPTQTITGTYWLALRHNTDEYSLTWEGRNGQSGGTAHQSWTDDEFVWGEMGEDLAFQLAHETSVVPEPGTMILLLTGVSGIAAARRRRRNARPVA
jgi:hypothetical protein